MYAYTTSCMCSWTCSYIYAPTTQRNAMQNSTTQLNTAQHNTTQHNATQHSTTQHSTTQDSTTGRSGTGLELRCPAAGYGKHWLRWKRGKRTNKRKGCRKRKMNNKRALWSRMVCVCVPA